MLLIGFAFVVCHIGPLRFWFEQVRTVVFPHEHLGTENCKSWKEGFPPKGIDGEFMNETYELFATHAQATIEKLDQTKLGKDPVSIDAAVIGCIQCIVQEVFGVLSNVLAVEFQCRCMIKMRTVTDKVTRKKNSPTSWLS